MSRLKIIIISIIILSTISIGFVLFLFFNNQPNETNNLEIEENQDPEISLYQFDYKYEILESGSVDNKSILTVPIRSINESYFSELKNSSIYLNFLRNENLTELYHITFADKNTKKFITPRRNVERFEKVNYNNKDYWIFIDEGDLFISEEDFQNVRQLNKKNFGRYVDIHNHNGNIWTQFLTVNDVTITNIFTFEYLDYKEYIDPQNVPEGLDDSRVVYLYLSTTPEKIEKDVIRRSKQEIEKKSNEFHTHEGEEDHDNEDDGEISREILPYLEMDFYPFNKDKVLVSATDSIGMYLYIWDIRQDTFALAGKFDSLDRPNTYLSCLENNEKCFVYNFVENQIYDITESNNFKLNNLSKPQIQDIINKEELDETLNLLDGNKFLMLKTDEEENKLNLFTKDKKVTIYEF